eukprot:9985143-Alexandrium_andersonii.AAC.1
MCPSALHYAPLPRLSLQLPTRHWAVYSNRALGPGWSSFSCWSISVAWHEPSDPSRYAGEGTQFSRARTRCVLRL